MIRRQQDFMDKLVQLVKLVARESGNRKRKVFHFIIITNIYGFCVVCVVFNLSYGKETCTYFLSLLHYLFLDWEVASSTGWPRYSQVQLCQLWPHASAPWPGGHGSKHRSWRGISLQGNPCWNMTSSIQLEYGLCGVLKPHYQDQSHYKGHLQY